MAEEIKQKRKRETEITGIDWKVIRNLQDLDDVPQDEIYDESVSASDFTLSLMPGLTNEEIEDALSTENMGTGKRFADVYFSNLMHLTVALKYAIGSVKDGRRN